jgi:hypothetical protein
MRDLLFILVLIFPALAPAQEVLFFTDGTDQTYYDQGLVDLTSLGGSSFTHTYPPGLPQYNDKIPCSATAYSGSSSLSFSYISADNGSWLVSVFRSAWTTANISGMDSISLYIYSAADMPASALPLIGVRSINKSGTAETSSALYPLSGFNGDIHAGIWKRITFPLKLIIDDAANSQLDFSKAKAIIFGQSEFNNSSRSFLIDQIGAFKYLDVIPSVINLTATGYDSHCELEWSPPMANLSYNIYASYDNGQTFELRASATDSIYVDFVPADKRNSPVSYRVTSFAQYRESLPSEANATLRAFSDDELTDMVERHAFRYFWECADKGTGMVRERSDGNDLTVASGGTGMGLMAMIVAHERQYRTQDEIRDRIIKILSFLETCDRHHGAWSHWYDASTGHTQPFSADDDGGDLVETSYVAQALIALKNYFTGQDSKSTAIRNKADLLWKGIEWTWYRQYGQNVLYWHWSPNAGFKINMAIRGWNECLVTYILAAASPSHGIPKTVYTEGWADNGGIVNPRNFYNYPVTLSPDWGGPLFWIHYSHLGINPHNLKDQYADYWKEHVNTALIQHEYASENPMSWPGYSDKCWGLTASDDPDGYTAHQPVYNDNGTISPTAALGSMPYAPAESMAALKYFYRERGSDVFGKFGFVDAFNDYRKWVKKAYLAIDKGPEIIMPENQRTGLLWNLVMQDLNVRTGLERLGFQYDDPTGIDPVESDKTSIYAFPNPCGEETKLNLQGFKGPAELKIFTVDGRLIKTETIAGDESEFRLNCSEIKNGLYLIRVTDKSRSAMARLVIRK